MRPASGGPDLNKYDLHHRVSTIPDVGRRVEETSRPLWASYFTWEHMETVTRRHARLRGNRPKKALQYLNEFRMLYENEGVHTLEGGVIRRKRRRARRPGMKREPALLFYPKFALESARKAWNYWRGFRREKALLKQVLNDPARYDYADLASGRSTTMNLRRSTCSTTRGGVEAVEKQQRGMP